MFTTARIQMPPTDALRARLEAWGLPRRHDYRGVLRRPSPGLRAAS